MSIFTKVKMPNVGSSKFNLSHDIKLSCDMGELIPICVMDVLPGDQFRISVEAMLRFAPLIAPVMHKYKVKMDFFFVANRILMLPGVWADWITGENELEWPHCTGMHNVLDGDLGDYLGYPGGGANNSLLEVNVFPIAAYFKIYDEYYRDENLVSETFLNVTNGLNPSYTTLATGNPLKRAWMHDYFTSCLPFAQKGDAVTIPILTNQQLDVESAGAGNVTGHVIRGISDFVAATADDVVVAGTGELHVGAQGEHTIDPNGDWIVDFDGEVSTIETLRNAFRLQEWLEKNARGGTRYIEHIKAHFGVFSSDKRLQRPEYIGGSSQNMIISEVLSTAASGLEAESDTPIGELAGHGISVGKGNIFTYRAEEHGFIIGIMSVNPVTAYHQGLAKMYNRPSYLDYYYPTFANLGEQEVLNSEIYVGNETVANLALTFGYIPRFAEYKYMSSRIAGDFRTSLEYWQHGRKFASAPALNETFITCDPDKRIFAVESESLDSVYAHVFNNVTAIRKMPKYALPSI